jgi:hypothetical protein
MCRETWDASLRLLVFIEVFENHGEFVGDLSSWQRISYKVVMMTTRINVVELNHHRHSKISIATIRIVIIISSSTARVAIAAITAHLRCSSQT